MAARRLAVLSEQLQAPTSDDSSPQSMPQPTAGSKAGPGTFTVIDNTTGKSYIIDSPLETAPADIVMSATRPRNRVGRRGVQFIGAPFAMGQNLSGTELAPMAMREAGIKPMVERLGWQFLDDGDLYVQQDSEVEKTLQWRKDKYSEWVSSGSSQSYSEYAQDTIRSEESVHVSHTASSGDPYSHVKNSLEIGECCKLIHDKVVEASSQGNFALTIGGDHSLGSATIGGLLQTYPDLAVVWVDAHADANTPETSPSNHYHGMPAAHVMGWFKRPVPGFEWLKSVLPENRIAYIGLRDIDPEEGKMLQESGVHAYTMQHVDRLGISRVVAMALSRIDPYGNRPLHVSFDIDGIDPVYAPGTGTCARGGLTYRESHFIVEELATTNRLVGMDLVEVNPLVDHLPERMHGDDPSMSPTSQTVGLGVELTLSALGKNILNIDPQQSPVQHEG